MLEIVFDRLVRLMTTNLRNFTSDNVEVSLDNISSIRFGDYLNSIPLPAIISVVQAKQLDNYGLITVDSNLIYSIVDVLLGGRRGTAAMRIEGRPYTTIGYRNGPNPRDRDGEPLTSDIVLDPDYQQESAVPLRSETHSGADVALFATGARAHYFGGSLEQNSVYHLMAAALGWDADAPIPDRDIE